MSNKEWMNNPALKNIDKNKLELLLQLTSQAGSKSGEDFLPFLMSAFSGENGIDFNDEETNIILEAMKPGMSPKEIKRIDTIKRMTKIIAARSKPAANNK